MKRSLGIVAVCAFLAFCPADSRAQQLVSADFDSSGAVDFLDFSRWVAAFGESQANGASSTRLDLNGDGTIDGEDAFLFADVFSDDAPEATLTVSSGPNGNARLELDPTKGGFLVYLRDAVRFGGYRISLSLPDTVKVTHIEDFLGIGLLPVRQTSTGVEIVGLVLGNKAIEHSGLIAGLTFSSDSTGVADTGGVGVTAVHLRGQRVSLGNHLYLGDRNEVPAASVKRIEAGEIQIEPRFFDLGEVLIGASITRSFSIENTFDDQQALGAARNVAFELTSSDASISVEPKTFGVLADTSTGLVAGDTKTIAMTIVPTALGAFDGRVDIRTNRSERPLVNVHLKARVVSSRVANRVRVFADFDSSGTVDYGDFDALIRRFGAAPDSAKFDLDADGKVDADDAFLLSDVLGGASGRASFDTVRVVSGGNAGADVRAEDAGELITVSSRGLNRLGGYRLILQYDADSVDVDWAQDLSGGGLMPIYKTTSGAEIVGMGFGALVEHSGDRALARVHVRPLNSQANSARLVAVPGIVLRGARGERDSIGVARIGANELDASPRVIDFGRLRIGATAEKTFRVYNLGSASTSFHVASSDSLVTTRPRSVGNLGAGRTWDVKVTYVSTTPGSFASSLTISASGDDPSPITVAVKAFGTVVSVAPDSLNYGEVFVGQNALKSVAVTNPELVAFDVLDLGFASDDTAFVLDPEPTLPLSVPEDGGTLELPVRFNPLVQGDVRDTLRIVGADTSFAIPLLGKGLVRAAELSAEALDFGSVDLGRDTTLTLRASNIGNLPYFLDSLKVGRRDSSRLASGSVDTSFTAVLLPAFPDTLLTGGSADTFAVRFRPDTTGAKVDTLRLYSADTTWVVPLSGTGLPRPTVEPPPAENVLVVTFGGSITKTRNLLHFGKVAWNKTHSLKVRVQNHRSGNLTFRFAATDSQIAVEPDSVQNLPPDREWDVVLRMTPTDSIQTLSEFRITTDDVGDGVTVIPVKSGGSNPVLLPSTVDFGDVGLGNGLSQTVTLTNTGRSRLVLETLAFGPDTSFVLVKPPTLPIAIAAEGDKLDLELRFQPTVRRAFVDTLRFGGVDTAFALAVAGRGRESRAVLAPDSLAFGLLAVGQTDTLAVALRSVGQDAVLVDALKLVDTGTPFALVDSLSLPDTLRGGAARTLRVAFAPLAAASFADTLRVIAGLDTLLAPISGTGTVAQANPSAASLDFGNVEVGLLSSDTLRVLNAGNIPFVINGVALQNGARGFALLDLQTYPHAIAVGDTLRLPLQFEPDSTDSRADTLLVTGIDTNFAIDLSGQGAPSLTVTRRDTGLSLSHTRLDFGDLAAGQTGKRIVRVTNAGTDAFTFSMETGAGALAIRPASLTALPVGISWDLVAQWTPTDQSPLRTDLQILSSGTVSVPTGRNGIFTALLTDSLAFGDVRVGQDLTLVARVRNLGQGTAVIQSLQFGAQSAFSVVAPPALPYVLQGRDSLLVSVVCAPTSPGSLNDTLRVIGRDTSLAMPVAGRGIQPAVSVTPETLDFGDRVAGTDSVASVVILNAGNGAFVLDSLKFESPQGMFAVVSAHSFPKTLVPNGGADTVRIKYAPADLGTYAGTLRFYGGAERYAVALLGKSTATRAVSSGVAVSFGAGVVLSDSTLSFGEIPPGSSRSLSFVVENNRDSTLAVAVASTDPQVTIAPPSVSGLFPSQNATFTASFAPVSQGATTVVLNVTSNATADGTIRLLAQKARPPVRVEPLSLAFGEGLIGRQDTLKATITNPEVLNFRVTAYAFGQRGPFALVDPPSLPDTVHANGGTRTLTVGFLPAARGSFVDTLDIVGEGRRFRVALSGTGLLAQAQASADSLTFGAVLIGEDSTRSVSVTNTGDVPLVLRRIDLDAGAFGLVDTLALPDTLSVGEERAVRVRFAPGSEGSLRGDVAFVLDAQSVSVALAGTGVAPPRTAPGPVALDLDLAVGDQGIRRLAVAGRDVAVDLAATEDARGKSGFQVVLRFDAGKVAYREFAAADLFEGATPIVTESEGQVQVSVAFLGAQTAVRDSGSLGQVRFSLLGDAGESEIRIASAQFARPSGPSPLEIGSEGASIAVSGTAEPRADFDGDGEVGFSDFLAFAGKFGTKTGDPVFDSLFDLDGDGEVGFSDFLIFAGKFGTQTGKPALAKPAVD